MKFQELQAFLPTLLSYNALFASTLLSYNYNSIKKNPTRTSWILKFLFTNSSFVTPTHDAYLDNGTNIRLTVGIITISLILATVNTQEEIQI